MVRNPPPKSDEVKSSKDFLFIKSEYKILRINFDDIKYIEVMSEYIRIHLNNAKPVMTLLSMRSIEEQLPAERFMRIHLILRRGGDYLR